ncbi:kinesin-like protein KIN-14H isoform X3 [Phoenix dactylifera]|uniref:Kinesin-like protein KIN-14H isoform X3 n=1 Tax=Phoenix dactylifera TaxID=42345 RepID=A0A8B9A0R6_PHODC|nr:kinesin-like protein KIN-14H isoform X3 [Phoenix dactylifera]
MSSRNQNRPPPTPVFDPTPSPSNVRFFLGITLFTSREDVERLLGEKMKGKNQNDYKGKSEQMIEYIKKLRTCIRWFMELEDGYLADQEKLRSMLDSEEKRHAEIEAQMRAKVEELNAIIQDLQRQHASLLESFRKEAFVKSYETEREARIAVENLRAKLSEELEKVF